jgi:hypothetical protein
MSNIKKLMMSGAGGGDPLDVDDVFSTYLYTGNGTSQTITNGLDLAGEGGLIWSKYRSGSGHLLYDTERGIDYVVSSSSAEAQYDYGGDITSVNSDGFSLGYYSGGVNYSGRNYVTWSFRKAPKFFDIVTYNGNSTARTISHNLGQKPGMIIIKALNNVRDWAVWHKDLVNNNGFLMLNTTNTESANSDVFTTTDPTSTEFSIGTDLRVNYSAFSYVAYVFADNNGEGEFGPDSDQDIIKCGSYTGNGSSAGPVVNVGFEPQFLLIKGSSGSWTMVDSMRGLCTKPAYSAMMYANRTYADNYTDWFDVTPTGFQPSDSSSDINASGHNYIYMAIRRGSLFPPESATEVFQPNLASAGPAPASPPTWYAGFPPDFGILIQGKSGANSKLCVSRLTQGRIMYTDGTAAEFADTNWGQFDNMTGIGKIGLNSTNWFANMWKRAPGFFDVVEYTGNGSAGHNINHSLGAVPEMIWIKGRGYTSDWVVYHSSLGATKVLKLNTNAVASGASSSWWNNTAPTATQFTLGSNFGTNDNGSSYISYLFCTLAGISKVGSFSHTNGSSTNVSCGFSNGARFVLVKRTDADVYPAGWYFWDATRGIVSGNDPYLLLNNTDAEVTNTDYINPLSSGFQMDSNFITGSYVFYAVA